MKYILLFLISFTAMADNWMPISKVVPGATSAYELESECLKQGEACINVNPVVVERGFFTSEGDVFTVDQAALDAYNAVQATLAADLAAEKAALSRMDCGRLVIAKLLVRNSSKSLTQEQVALLSSTYAPIQGLLLNGSLETAKSLIQAAIADGVVVTAGDKTALVDKLDSCKN